MDEVIVESAKTVAESLTVYSLSKQPCVSISNTATLPFFVLMTNGFDQMTIAVVSSSAPPRHENPVSGWSRLAVQMLLSRLALR